MLSVFKYSNYRTFLADYYNQRKQENHNFSYKVFSDKAGFCDKGFIHSLINDRRNMSKQSIYRLAQAMGLKPAESDYFENLVAFNQATDLKEQNHYFEKLCQIKNTGKAAGVAKILRQDQYEYFSKWYYPVIRSLINRGRFKDDFQLLAKSVHPRIRPKDAKKAVQTLEKLGLIIRNKDGVYRLAEKTVTTEKEISSLAARNFHAEMAKLGHRAICELPKDRRYLTGMTLGISRKTYDAMCDRVNAFGAEMIAMAAKDNEADRVYHMNIQLFPVSSDSVKK